MEKFWSDFGVPDIVCVCVCVCVEVEQEMVQSKPEAMTFNWL